MAIVDEISMYLQQRCAAYSNFWLSTGCDVPPDTPWENLEELMGV